MKVSDRFTLVLHQGLFRRGEKQACGQQPIHGRSSEAPVPPSLWERMRLFELHDREALYRAVDSGDAPSVRKALANPRCNPHDGGRHESPVIRAAAGRPHIFCVPAQLGLDFSKGNPEILQMLLDDHRVNINAREPATKAFALKRATDANDADAVHRLARHGAKLQVAANGWSLLGSATRQQCNEAAAALLDLDGADVHAHEPTGHSAFTLAAETGNVGLLEIFLGEGGADINGRDARGFTALAAAAASGRMEAVEFLLEHAADPDIGDTSGRLPAWHAVDGGEPLVLRKLMQATRWPQRSGMQAMVNAIVKNDRPSVVELVRDHRFDLGQDLSGRGTPKSFAKASGRPQLAHELSQPMVAARRWKPAQIVEHLQEHPHHTAQMMAALGKVGDLGKVGVLAGTTALQAGFLEAAALAILQSRWSEAAVLVQGINPDRWDPLPQFLRKTVEESDLCEANREHRRTIADCIGEACLRTLSREDSERDADRWQADLRTLPGRLASIVFAALADPSLALGDMPQSLTQLFDLSHVAEPARADVARAALAIVDRLNGQGVHPYEECGGDFRFRPANQDTGGKREVVANALIRTLTQHANAKPAIA